MRIKTYTPKNKEEFMNKEETFPLLIDVGEKFANIGSIVSFFISSLLLSIRTFFKTKKKIREFKSRYEKTLDLR